MRCSVCNEALDDDDDNEDEDDDDDTILGIDIDIDIDEEDDAPIDDANILNESSRSVGGELHLVNYSSV